MVLTALSIVKHSSGTKTQYQILIKAYEKRTRLGNTNHPFYRFLSKR